MDIVVATNNKNKLREIREILGEKFGRIYSLDDLALKCDVEETEETFEGNALLKAKAVAKLSGMPALSDDSGLCVDALNGAPGVHSARYSGTHGDDEKNIDCLLKNLVGKPSRKASFVSCVALCFPSGEAIVGRGESFGEILFSRDGKSGFGYDPIFFSYELQKSFGKASEEEKNAVSHRAKALKDLLKKL